MEKSDRKQIRRIARRCVTPSDVSGISRRTWPLNRRPQSTHLSDGPDYRDPELSSFASDHPRITA